MKISATVIAKNEEARISDCLNSLKAVADEIILVDSGSKDNTIAIAKSLGAKVIHHEFEGHVQQKNYAMEQAQYEWILSLDADEMLSAEAITALKKVKQESSTQDGFSLNRLNNYCGKWLRHGGWYPDRKIRLWKKAKGQWGGMNPHDEVIMAEGSKVDKLNVDILHFTYDVVEDHRRQMVLFAQIIAQSYFDQGKRTHPIEIIVNPVFSFIRDYILKGGFLDGRAGWTANVISGKYQYWKYRNLWRLQKGQT